MLKNSSDTLPQNLTPLGPCQTKYVCTQYRDIEINRHFFLQDIVVTFQNCFKKMKINIFNSHRKKILDEKCLFIFLLQYLFIFWIGSKGVVASHKQVFSLHLDILIWFIISSTFKPEFWSNAFFCIKKVVPNITYFPMRFESGFHQKLLRLIHL